MGGESRHDQGVLIESPQGESLRRVNLTFTPSEAWELRDSLDDLLSAGDPARHEHISSADYQTELTVVVTHH